jgi:hypothetical protein
MKQKLNPQKRLQPNDGSNLEQPSKLPQNSEPSVQTQNPGTDLSNQPDRFPKELLDIVREAGIEVKGAGAKGKGKRAKGTQKSAIASSSPNGLPSSPFVRKSQPSDEFASERHSPATEQNPHALPTLPDSIFPTLPCILQKVLAMAGSKEERDIMLMGSLTSFGACLPKFHGYYDGIKIFPYLYLFITAKASAGKGRLALCKQLVMPVHLLMRQESQRLKDQYEEDLQEYYQMRGKNSKIKKPVKPPELMLIIPANNSATGVFQLLYENGGKGLLFETEGDTLAQAFKADHGNYSDGLRKGAQHEAITYYRRTDREFVEILCTCIATVLSGTPEQVALLIHSAENGLLSRFIFYHMNIRPVWKDVFAAKGHKNLEEYFNQLGQEFLPLYKALNKYPEIEFSFSEAQQKQFNAYFEQIQQKYMTLQGIDYIATIRRMGLIAFRIAMVLSALRILETGDFSTQQVCSEVDFQTTLSMVNVLVKHSSHVFSELTQDKDASKPKDKMEQFLDQLPGKFNRTDFIALAKSLFIAESTAYRYISIFLERGLIFRELQGAYTKTELRRK